MADEEQKFADKCNQSGHRKGITPEEVIEHYDKWATGYDGNLSENIYRGPSAACDAAVRFYDENQRKTIRVLDFAAGTGKVGEKLNAAGFVHIDALEPSTKSIEVARSKNIYENFIVEFLSGSPGSSPSNFYDLAISSGGYGEGHIPKEAMAEIARVVKPGGHIIIATRKAYFSEVENYRGFDDYIAKLISDGWLKELARDSIEKYSWNNEGVLFTFKVLKESA